MRHIHITALLFFMSFCVYAGPEMYPPSHEIRPIQSSMRTTPVIAPRINIMFQPSQVRARSKRSERKTRTTVYAGSLRDNIKRIAAHFGWKRVLWNAPYDFNWVGTTPIRARSLSSMLTVLLKNYPLQADFYAGNHVLVIMPRVVSS